MLRTIEEAGYLTSHPKKKTFRLSRKLLPLAQSIMAQEEDRERIDNALRAIAARTGETCHYSVLEGKETILMQRAKGIQLVAVDFQIGTRCELHVTSIGKALLAHQSQAFQSDYLEQELVSYTDRTYTNPPELSRELDRIRDQGASYDLEEMAVGMNCVAVPIHDFDGKVTGGISISGPITRLTPGELKRLAEIIKDEIGKMDDHLA